MRNMNSTQENAKNQGKNNQCEKEVYEEQMQSKNNELNHFQQDKALLKYRILFENTRFVDLKLTFLEDHCSI